ncbi:MAG: hypothetical protein WA688_02465, partial [Thermoplasmata archaeon]
MNARTTAPSKLRTLPILGTVIVAGAILVMLLALPVLASPLSAPAVSSGLAPTLSPALNPAVQQWAYGGTKTISGDISVTGSNGNGFELQYHAFYGWTVVFTQTNNTTNSGFQIESQRTAAAELWVNLCTPDCASPTWTGNYTANANEIATAFGNFTRDGTVYVDGASSPALGFLNGSGATQDALHSKLTVTGAMDKVSNWWFNVTGVAQAQVSFNPELGLIPYSLTAGESWNSSAAFVLTGNYALQWDFVGPHTQSSGTPSGTISANGTVDLVGAYSQDLLLNNKENTHILLLALSGPFDVFDGVIILPHMGNVFSGDPKALGGQGLGFAPVAATSAVDYDTASSHLGIAAAATTFAPGVSGSVPTTAVTPMATATSGGDIQAQPMTVPVAQSCASSLAKGGTCATTPTYPPIIAFFHTSVGEVVALAVGVVALVAVLG